MKAWFKSKTIWFNLFALAVNVAELATLLLPAFELMLSVQAFMIFNGTVTAINIILRFITDKGVFIKPPQEDFKAGGTG